MSPTAISDLTMGMSIKVRVAKQEMTGIVRFLGTTDFSEGDWVGVELEEAHGKNNGTVKDRCYFTCKAEHGLFVRPAFCSKLSEKQRKSVKAKQDAKNLRLALSEALEENDEEALAQLIPEAQAHGVERQEVDFATRRLEALRSGALRSSIVVEPEAEDAPLIKLLGGEKRVEEFRKASEKIRQRVAESLRANESVAVQPAIFQGMGLENMLKLADHFKSSFDGLCGLLTEKMRQRWADAGLTGYDVEFCPAEVKSIASAASKVSTEYHGDCRLLKDVVRGTLVIKCDQVDENTIQVAYEMLEALVGLATELREYKAHFTRFSDRYQRPVGPGKYRDWLFLLKISDFICELQVNFERAVQVKQDEQHHVYEKERLGTRKLLEASMSNDENMVRILLSTDIQKGHLVSARDYHGFTPLHYAARHGSTALLGHLLEAGADVAALDSEGHPALYHATMMEHVEASKLLVKRMLAADKDWRKPRLRDSLQSILGAAYHSPVSGMKELAKEMAILAKKAYPAPCDHLHGLARAGDTLALRAAMLELDLDLKSLMTQKVFDPLVGQSFCPMDNAVRSGSVDIVKELRKTAPSALLEAYDSAEEVQLIAAGGQVAQFRALQAARTLSEEEVVKALMTSCKYQRLEMAHAIWSTASFDLAAVLDDTQKEKLAELAGEAAAQGHVDFVRLVIEAKVPLEYMPKRTGLPMMIRAAMTGQVEVIEALAEGKATASVQSLSFALACREAQAAETLIRLGADPNGSYRDEEIATPTGQVIASDLPKMLKLLQKKGVEVATEKWLAFAKKWDAQVCAALIEEMMLKKALRVKSILF